MSNSGTEIIDGIEYKYSSDWIYKLESKEHWSLYHTQAELILKYVDFKDTILEIGKGTGFLSNYLKSKDFRVTTFDIDEEKKPDIKGNIVQYKFEKKYDHIVAFEVFEHIPYEKFEAALNNLSKICNKTLIISVPKNEKVWATINVKTLISNFSVRFATRRNKLIEDHHFWEIGYKDYTVKRLKKSLNKESFEFIESKKLNTARFFVFKKHT